MWEGGNTMTGTKNVDVEDDASVDLLAPRRRGDRRLGRQYTFVVDDEMDARVLAFADKHRIPKSEAIRQFLSYGADRAERLYRKPAA
jgi:hypothetical protein